MITRIKPKHETNFETKIIKETAFSVKYSTSHDSLLLPLQHTKDRIPFRQLIILDKLMLWKKKKSNQI